MIYILKFTLFLSVFIQTQTWAHDESHALKTTHASQDTAKTTSPHKHSNINAQDQDQDQGHEHEHQHDHEDQDKETSSSDRFGRGKAVEDFDEHLGFKLSSKAMQNMKVNFTRLNQKGPWVISKQALVYIKHRVGVYRKHDDWISLVWVNTQHINDTHVSIHTTDLQPNDEVAMSGASFLRMTDADLNSNTTDSHAH
ncbi:MAG: hypothetical protein M9899_03430 [Bdellovibrionaceae bacterium]|nr:hypothetical protein [Pseudobdellovibrionaceae bacterium]